MSNDSTEKPVRIDKWLWAARFFKTRSLASKAVSGGKVHINGQRAKPARTVRINDRLDISIGNFQRQVDVRALSDQRGPAKTAVTLYEETEASIAHREQTKAMRQMNAMVNPVHNYQPTRKDRRELARLKGKPIG